MTRAVLLLAGNAGTDRALAAAFCRACVDGLDVDGAAASILTGTAARETLCATDPTAEIIEELQFTLNEGACIEAAATGYPVLVTDLHDRTEYARWPVFTAAVTERTGARALFALPMQWGAVNLGVLDLYRDRPGPLSAAQQRDVLSAADVAAVLMLGRLTAPDGDTARLDGRVVGRPEIHQATGMVLVQLGLTAPEALAAMRGHAFAHGRRLIDVARDVVARRLDFSQDGGDSGIG